MNRAAAVALTALAPVSWGSTYVVTTEFLPPDRPLFTALLRALPAGLLLLAATRALPRGAWWWKAAVLGALNIGAFFPLLFLAAYRLPGGVAAVVASVGPLFAVGLAALLLSERPTVRTLATAIAATLGVSLVVLQAGAAFDLVGVIAGLAGAASMSAGVVLTKRWGRPDGVGPLAMTGWQLTAGGVLIAPLALLVEGAPPAFDARGLAGYLYLALINTALAYWLWFRGIERLSATSAILLGPLSPLTATVIGWAALGQALTAVQLMGVTVAFGATLVGQLGPRRTGTEAPALDPAGSTTAGAPAAARPAPAGGAEARSPTEEPERAYAPTAPTPTWTKATAPAAPAVTAAPALTAAPAVTAAPVAKASPEPRTP
ncbi:EamA family transporter [Streptomyces sp. NPDC005953]|uniref:EamA family transporter n=1 Tax=Streptomyces sp. NPDC005953 TaxID=3156719 RepID=UPI0033C1979C